MKDDIHPDYIECTVTCGCGNSFKICLIKFCIAVEICGACYFFYTGQQKFVDTAGRIEKFMKRAGAKKGVPAAAAKDG